MSGPASTGRDPGRPSHPREARGLLSVVIPCYNECAVLPLLRARLTQVLDGLSMNWEVVLVNDGSFDGTAEILAEIHASEPRYKTITLSRNFGHQAAVAAGLAYASGDVVAIMDADLQDPPEVVRACIDRWRQGADVVFAVRGTRREGLIMRLAYRGFYRLLKALADVEIPLDSGDFCVMDRRVADVLRCMPERNIFMRGMRAWAGFRQEAYVYERDARAAGATKYSLSGLIRLAVDGIVSFSTLPLRLATLLGLAVVALNVFGIGLVMLWRFANFQFMGHRAQDIPGWAGALSVALFLGGVQLLMLGIFGEYLARIYEEVKHRPRWVVSSTSGLSRRNDAGE